MYLEIKKVNWLVCELTYGKPTPLIVDVHLARTNAEIFWMAEELDGSRPDMTSGHRRTSGLCS
jgi:hypothetical protein